MDSDKLKSVWAETIASDGWEVASVHLSYRPEPEARQVTRDYSSRVRRFRPKLPSATFVSLAGDVGRTLEPGDAGWTVGREPTFAPALKDLETDPTIDITGDGSEAGDGGRASEPVAAEDEAGWGAPRPVVRRPGTDPGHLDTDRGHVFEPVPEQAKAGAPAVSGIELRRVDASYAIRGELGRGGMGIIYRAVQASLDREVAVKTLRREKATGASRDKFIAEALVTGDLDHPNVVPVHELGTNQDGEVFLAMKLVHGRSWQDLLRPRTPADLEAARGWGLRRHIDVLLHVTNAVSYAHSKGILHRDLKPENVMVGDYGEILLMDWGIAVDIREPAPERPRAMHKSEVSGPAGTPVYMAPEQAEGRGTRLGEWTDVFLLGAILHEIVTGSPPHQRPGARLLDVLVTASRCEPPVYGDDVPRALQEICKRAMRREPERRFADVADFRAALQAWLRNSESLRLADEADALAASAVHGGIPARDRYGIFTRALARYEQALVTWRENEQALRGQAAAAVAYADEALGRQDYGVVEAQLDLLRGHPFADEQSVRTLRRAVERQSASRVRTAAALLLIVGASIAAYQGLSAVAERARERGAEQAATHGFDRKAQDAWAAVASGDLLEVSRAEARLAEDPVARTREGKDRVATVRAAKKLMLWQQARYQELFNIQCRDFRGALQRAGVDFAKLGGTSEAGLAGALLGRTAEEPSARAMCDAFETELVTGTPASVLLWVFDQMQQGAPAAARRRLRRRRRLLDAATCELSQRPVELAASSTRTDPCLHRRLPFSLAIPPVGPRLRRRPPPPRHASRPAGRVGGPGPAHAHGAVADAAAGRGGGRRGGRAGR